MNKLSKDELILRAVELGKKSAFGVTGVKIELEAKFGREYTSTGRTDCTACGGRTTIPHGCSTGCEGCEWESRVRCPKCLFDAPDFSDNNYCQQWLLKTLSKSGLASLSRSEHQYVAKQPLVFCKFYTDPSVDSEFTATLSLKKSENIFLLPKLVEAFNALGEAIGNGCNVENAGMHMALLNDKHCYYNPNDRPDDARLDQYRNFKKSMALLMPALFFLGSSNEKSRSLHFREPKVSLEKYSAVHYIGGALEFRVFNTCYDNPDAVLDNFVVMRNCIRFWTNKYRSPRLDKIAASMYFGNDDGDTLARLYTTTTHLDILNAGLQKIKPAYYSIKELKRQRSFGTTKRHLNKAITEATKQAEAAYKEYESRFAWGLIVAKEQHKNEVILYANLPHTPEEQATVLEQAEQAGAEYAEHIARDKQTVTAYVREQLNKFDRRHRGAFQLIA